MSYSREIRLCTCDHCREDFPDEQITEVTVRNTKKWWRGCWYYTDYLCPECFKKSTYAKNSPPAEPKKK